MKLRTRFIDLVGTGPPIVQGGMMMVGRAALAAAVSTAGALGILTALTQPTPDTYAMVSAFPFAYRRVAAKSTNCRAMIRNWLLISGFKASPLESNNGSREFSAIPNGVGQPRSEWTTLLSAFTVPFAPCHPAPLATHPTARPSK